MKVRGGLCGMNPQCGHGCPAVRTALHCEHSINLLDDSKLVLAFDAATFSARLSGCSGHSTSSSTKPCRNTAPEWSRINASFLPSAGRKTRPTICRNRPMLLVGLARMQPDTVGQSQPSVSTMQFVTICNSPDAN